MRLAIYRLFEAADATVGCNTAGSEAVAMQSATRFASMRVIDAIAQFAGSQCVEKSRVVFERTSDGAPN
jgi:hypothetical protein